MKVYRKIGRIEKKGRREEGGLGFFIKKRVIWKLRNKSKEEQSTACKLIYINVLFCKMTIYVLNRVIE